MSNINKIFITEEPKQDTRFILSKPEATKKIITERDFDKVYKNINKVAPKCKQFIALLTQVGTNAPEATILENTLGESLILSRQSTGNYTINNPNNLFSASTTTVSITCGNTSSTKPQIVIGGYDETNDVIRIKSFNSTKLSDNVISDKNGLYSTWIQIKVY